MKEKQSLCSLTFKGIVSITCMSMGGVLFKHGVLFSERLSNGILFKHSVLFKKIQYVRNGSNRECVEQSILCL